MKIYFVLLRFGSVSLATAILDGLIFFIAYNQSGNVLGVADTGARIRSGFQLPPGAQFGFLFAPAPQIRFAEIPAAGCGQRDCVVLGHPTTFRSFRHLIRFLPRCWPSPFSSA
jgi:hypothetical protein